MLQVQDYLGGSGWNLFGRIKGCSRFSRFVDYCCFPSWVYISCFFPLHTRHQKERHQHVNLFFSWQRFLSSYTTPACLWFAQFNMPQIMWQLHYCAQTQGDGGLKVSLILGQVWRGELVGQEDHRWGNKCARYSNQEVNLHWSCWNCH